MLAGVVEMDESYVGGIRKGKRGRGASGKTAVAVMCEQNESGGCSLAHMQVVEDTGGISLGEAAVINLPSAQVFDILSPVYKAEAPASHLPAMARSWLLRPE